MSITTTSGRDIESKGIPSPTYPVINQYTDYSQVWTRNSEWPTLPDISSTDQKIVGLMSINDTQTNYVAIMCTVSGAATYTIDWGDGSTPSTVNSPAQGQYNYDFASVPGPILSDGTKIVTITVTPSAGGVFTTINLNRLSTLLARTTSTKWLDLAINSSTTTSLYISSTAGTRNTTMPKLEQVKIHSLAASCSISYLFDGLNSLQSIPVFNVSNLTSTVLSYTFNGCNALKIAPNFSLSVASVSMFFTFLNCYSLQYVPNYTFIIGSGNNGLYYTFQNCYNLVSAPFLKTGLATDFRGTFAGCKSLLYVPLYDTGNATNMADMFNGCANMTTIPPLNTNKVTDFSTMFINCRTLENIPSSIKTANSTYNLSMFDSCYSLIEIPPLDLNKSTVLNKIFANCFNLETVPSMNLEISGNSMDSANMFANCTSLTSIPDFKFSTGGMVAGNMFANCSSLTTMPNIDYSLLNNCASMFSGCSNIANIPANINFSNVTNGSLMFLNCVSLKSVPDLNMPNNTNGTSMFNGCTNIETIGNISIPKVTNITSMFQSCPSLISIGNVTTTANLVTVSNAFNASPGLEKLPNLDYSGATVASTLINNSTGLAGGLLSNLKLSVSLATASFGRNNIELLIDSLGSNTTAQTLTITGNPGAPSAITKTASGIVAGSGFITMADTSGIVVGMQAYGAGLTTGIAVSFPGAPYPNSVRYTNALTSNPVTVGMRVLFTSITTTTGISVNTSYWVVAASSNSFQISTTQGGAPLTLTNVGTGVMNVGGGATSGGYIIGNVVQVNTGNVVVQGCAGVTNSSLTITFRNLNTTMATAKNWTITG